MRYNYFQYFKIYGAEILFYSRRPDIYQSLGYFLTWILNFCSTFTPLLSLIDLEDLLSLLRAGATRRNGSMKYPQEVYIFLNDKSTFKATFYQKQNATDH
jgi:hypothetical protein